MNPFDMVYEQICTSPLLAAADRRVVKEIAQALDLGEYPTLAAVNIHIIEQNRLEAYCVYLTSKYQRVATNKEVEADKLEANAILSIPEKDLTGRKYLAADRSSVLTTNAEVSESRNVNNEAKALFRDINNLAKLVEHRNSKLEALTVNFRREMALDSQKDS